MTWIFSRGDQEKMNLQGPVVLVLGLKISQEGVTQLCGVSVVRLFVRNFQGQSEKPKSSRGVSKQQVLYYHILNPPTSLSFSGIADLT